MAITGSLPYDVNNLLAGAARVLISDTSPVPALPANLADIVDLTDPYAPATGWIDIGATTDASAYSRDMTEQDYTIEQTNAPVLTDITEVTRTLRCTVGEITPEHLQIIEEAAAIGTLAAATGKSAQKQVKFGTIGSLTRRRVAFVGQRNKASGTVDEPASGPTRGRFVALCLYNAQISAEAAEVSLGKGNLASVPITFKAYPEDGEASGSEFGTWFLEDAGAIT
jgi:hypothetical protein